MKPIQIGSSLYVNIPRPTALKKKITKDTDLVLFDKPGELSYVIKENLTIAHSGNTNADH